MVRDLRRKLGTLTNLFCVDIYTSSDGTLYVVKEQTLFFITPSGELETRGEIETVDLSLEEV